MSHTSLAEDETADSTAPVSDPKRRRRRTFVGIALSIGAWAFLAAFGGTAAADDGWQPGRAGWSTGTTADVPAATPPPPAHVGLIPPLRAGGAPAAGPQAAMVDPTTVDLTTVETTTDPTTIVEITTVDPTTVETTTDPTTTDPTTTDPTTTDPTTTVDPTTVETTTDPTTTDPTTTVDPTTVEITTEPTTTVETTTDETTTEPTTTVEPTTTDRTTVETTTTEAGIGQLSADASGIEPGLPDVDLGPAAAAGAATTDHVARSGSLRSAEPDQCGLTDATTRPISGAAAVGGPMACAVGHEVDEGDNRAVPCRKVRPQPTGPSGAGQRPATASPDPTKVAKESGATTAKTATPPLVPKPPVLPEPDPPAQPFQLPRAPLAPVLPGAGSTVGGCANSVSAGAHQDAWSPLAIVDPDGAVLLPTASNGFITFLTPDVTAPAADPGSRPT